MAHGKALAYQVQVSGFNESTEKKKKDQLDYINMKKASSLLGALGEGRSMSQRKDAHTW